MEIYVLIDNQAQGPYTRELIRQYLNSGQLKPTDLAAYAGHSDWKPLSAMVRSWGGAAAKPAQAAPTTKRKSLIAIVAGIAVLIVAAGAVFWVMNHKSVQKSAAMDERHYPKSLAELNAWYVEPPEGQNAATFFLKGLDAIQVNEADLKSADLPIMGGGKMPELGQPLAPRTKASIAGFVQKNDDAWKSLQEGASFEDARYPIDLSLGSETMLTHLAKIKRAAQFAHVRTILAADNQQSQEAADSILLSLAVAQSLKNEPVLISQLVRVAANAIEVASLEYTLNAVALSQADLERLATAFAKAESRAAEGDAFTRTLVFERVSGLAFFDLPSEQLGEQLKKIQNAPIGDMPSGSVSEMTKNLKSQRAFFTKTMEHALAMRRDPFPQRLKLDEYMTSQANEAKTKEFYLCQMWLPGFGKATSREARGVSILRLAQAAIALERFHQEKGSYPDSLAALVPKFLPQIPIDPANGSEIQYQKSGTGYEVRSTAINAPKPESIKVVNAPKLRL